MYGWLVESKGERSGSFPQPLSLEFITGHLSSVCLGATGRILNRTRLDGLSGARFQGLCWNRPRFPFLQDGRGSDRNSYSEPPGAEPPGADGIGQVRRRCSSPIRSGQMLDSTDSQSPIISPPGYQLVRKPHRQSSRNSSIKVPGKTWNPIPRVGIRVLPAASQEPPHPGLSAS
jgi:hypothetical protein